MLDGTNIKEFPDYKCLDVRERLLAPVVILFIIVIYQDSNLIALHSLEQAEIKYDDTTLRLSISKGDASLHLRSADSCFYTINPANGRAGVRVLRSWVHGPLPSRTSLIRRAHAPQPQ